MKKIPGPLSRAWLRRLKVAESPNVTSVQEDFPVVWQRAQGATVTDVDGHEYLDASAAFGVALIGHGHPRVVAAACEQIQTQVHGMGDVHPPKVRIELLERLAGVAPGDLGHGVLCTGGSEAVEVALKTALLATGKPGTLAFHGGYHGLSTGALAVTSRAMFREPFAAHLHNHSHFASFPSADGDLAEALGVVDRLLASSAHDIGVVMVEPIQGRGGTVVPAAGWLQGLQELCRRHGALLCCDEIFTGLGRAGAWFASVDQGVQPDLLCVGKALGGGFPIAACLGRPDVMAAWGPSTGEALHTSTFLGHPVSCAAALATLDVIESEDIVERARASGAWLEQALRASLCSGATATTVVEVRGRGLMLGVQAGAGANADAAELVLQVVVGCLRRGVIVLPAGPRGDVLQLTPPAICTDAELARIVEVVAEAWREAAT